MYLVGSVKCKNLSWFNSVFFFSWLSIRVSLIFSVKNSPYPNFLFSLCTSFEQPWPQRAWMLVGTSAASLLIKKKKKFIFIFAWSKPEETVHSPEEHLLRFGQSENDLFHCSFGVWSDCTHCTSQDVLGQILTSERFFIALLLGRMRKGKVYV